MKTRINLLGAELLPATQRLTLTRLSGVLTVASALSIASLVGLVLKNYSDQHHIDHLKLTHQDLLSQKQAYEAQIEAHRADPRLMKQINETKVRLQLKNQLLQELNQRGVHGNQGFAALLTDLAALNYPDLWLERIQAQQQAFHFQGQTLKPENIPQWVAKLKQTQTLRGYGFSALTMQAKDKHYTGFQLISSVQGAEQPLLEIR